MFRASSLFQNHPSKENTAIRIAIVGPMFSGKSSAAGVIVQNAITYGKRALLITWDEGQQNRYGECNYIHTHDGKRYRSVPTRFLMSIPKELVEAADVVFINEAQFFSDLKEFVDTYQVFRQDAAKIINIVASGLNSDFNQKPFGNIEKITWTEVHVMHAICMADSCTNDAHHTILVTDKKPDENGTIIGGSSDFKSVCDLHLTIFRGKCDGKINAWRKINIRDELAEANPAEVDRSVSSASSAPSLP